VPKGERASRKTGQLSRKARRAAANHSRRNAKASSLELRRVQQNASASVPNSKGNNDYEVEFPSLPPPAPTPLALPTGTLPTKSRLMPKGTTKKKGSQFKHADKSPLFGAIQRDTENDGGWVGTPFLERVSLAGLAAAGVSKGEASRHAIHLHAVSGRAPEMKKQSAHHRSNWILRNGSRLDAQLSFIGRALPPASRSMADAALKQHRVDFTSSFSTSAVHLSGCKAFVRKWAKTMLVKPKVILEPPAWPSGSSCFERSSQKGGTLSFLLEKSSEQEPPVHFLSDAVSCEVAQDISLLGYALREFKKGDTPRHRVECITERGLKTRVVNVGPAWCQVLGHSVRKHLLRGLRATPGAHQPLKGVSDEELVGHFNGATAEVLISTDLTRATDLLPHDLVKAAVDGLEESGKLSLLEIDILRSLTGPQQLIYKGSDSPVLTSRGILMGLPTSWCLLSLIHLYWLDVAKAAAIEASGRRKPRIRSSICGDDALIATTVAGAQSYRQCVIDCGGSPSEGKHYEDTGVKSVRRGVFLEKLLEWGIEDGKLFLGNRFPAIPVKGLTSRNLPRDFLEDRLVSCRSFGIRQILSIDSLLSQNSCLEKPLRDYMIRRVAWLPAYADKVLGLIGGFPLSLGGFPLSPRPLDVSRAVWARDSGRSFSLAIQRELDPAWRMAVGFQEGGRELAIAEGELIDKPLDWDPESDPTPPLWVDVEEDKRFLRTVLPIYRQVVSWSAGPSRRTIHLRASDFVRSLEKIRAEGKAQPSGLLPDAPVKPKRIWWRLPNRETPERGLSWYDATEFNRSAYMTEVLCTLLEDIALLSRYKGSFKTPSEVLLAI